MKFAEKKDSVTAPFSLKSGVGSEAKKPSFGFGFASEKKEPLVNQNDGFGKKKVETPLSFGNTNASKQTSKFGDASTFKSISEAKGITSKTTPNTASESFSKSHQNQTPFQSNNVTAVKSPAKNATTAFQSLTEGNQADKITRSRRPKRQISKYERVVQEAFIRYFEGGETGDVLGNNKDQISMQEKALSNVQDSKKQLQDLDARITTLTQPWRYVCKY